MNHFAEMVGYIVIVCSALCTTGSLIYLVPSTIIWAVGKTPLNKKVLWIVKAGMHDYMEEKNKGNK